MYVQKSVSALLLVSLISPMLLTPLTIAQAYTAEVPLAERQQTQDAIQVKPDATGSSAYSIPLTIPPGRNGVQPNLGLSYSSNSTDNTSPFGYGWNISIPSISRIQKEGIDKLYTQDIFSSSIDGELVLVTAGNPAVYRPKYDGGAYNKYELSSNTWTVIAKDGTTYAFGNTAASRMDNPANSAQIYEWKISEIRDTNDNFARYTYYKDAGQIYPDAIYYTGKGATDGIFSVEFQRETRTDIVPSYRAQFKVLSNYRIKNITVKKSGVWVRKYALGYGTGVNGVRSMLASVTESGRDEQGNITALPAVLLEYQASNMGWSSESSWNVPALVTPNGQYQNIENGSRFADLNGDGMQDYVQTVYNAGASAAAQYTAYGKGTGWAPNLPYPVTFPSMFRVYNNGGIPDAGTRFGDLNGDGKDDAVRLYGNPNNQGDMTNRKVYENSGTAFTEATGYSIPVFNFSEDVNSTTGTFLLDLNGDGRGDLVNTSEAYLFGNGTTTGWQTNTSYSVTQPYGVGKIVNTADFNADGLVDYQHDILTQTSPTYVYTPRLLHFTGTSFQDSGAALGTPASDYNVGDMGVRSLDVNNDGLTDIVQSKEGASCGSSTCPLMQGVYINTGVGFTSNTYSLPSSVYFARVTSTGSGVVYTDSGERIIDVDGDMLPDLVGPMGSYRNTGKRADILTKVTLPQGGSVSYTYKTSLQYKDAQGNILNTAAPYPVYVVDTITTNDGQGFTDAKTYKYEGAYQYYAAYNDKQFGGFSIVTATDSAGNYTKTYYHQGNTTNTTLGEYTDHPSKIGRAYRVERYNAANALLSLELQKWESTVVGSRFVVNNTETKVLTYEGDSSHKDRAVSRTYDATNNNVLTETDWGEVTAATDGTFSDAGSDKTVTEYTYATDAAGKILSKPSKVVLKDNAGAVVAETKSTYDSLTWGNVSVGNETKVEQLISTGTYATTMRAFNSYGLVTSVTNPRNNETTYTYDAQNLYPATSTNPLTHVTTYEYNQIFGKPKLVTDANGFKVETTYDPLGRVSQVRTSDIASPAILVPVKQYTYTDIRNATSVYEKNYLTSSTYQDSYTYVDGFNRPMQVRTSGEGGQYAVSDTVYGRDGLVTSQTLPYFSTGGAKTSGQTNSALTTSFTYDALNRQLTASNVSGSITSSYTDWKKVVTDQLGKLKAYETDARGNLTKVIEYVSSTPYTTTYTYDAKNNLASITDALGNVRAFTYDALSRRMSAEDLHASGDTTYGTWSYVYDAQGNKTQETQPRGTVVNYVYDALDRVTSEDAPSTGGTDVTYTYDTGTYGKGRLTSAVRGTTTTNYTYTVRGDVSQESRAIAGDTFVTSYDYNRRADVTTLTTPDSAQVRYTYNASGNIEKIERKESGGAWTPVVYNYDYGPHGKVTVKQTANNTWTYNTYDPNELYRLRNISTIDPPMETPAQSVEEQAAALAEEVIVPVENAAIVTDEAVDTKDATEEELQKEEKVHAEASSTPLTTEVVSEIPVPTTVLEQPKTEDTLTNPIETAIKEVAEEILIDDRSLEVDSKDVEELAPLKTLAAQGEEELLALRTQSSYTVRVGRDAEGIETRTMRTFSAPIHQKGTKSVLSDGGKGKSLWRPIDTRLKRGVDSFESVDAPYKLTIPKDGDEGLATMSVGALSVMLEPTTQQVDSNDKKAQRKKDSGSYVVETPNAIVDGIAISMRADNSGVTKDVILKNADALKSLTENSGFYEIPFTLTVPEGATLIVNGKEVGSEAVETTSIAKLALGDDAIYIRPAVIHDAGVKATQVTLSYVKSDTGYTLTKRIPVEWFKDATYPLTTDAVLSYYPDTSDGSIGYGTYGWSTVRAATTGTYMGSTESYGPVTSSGGGTWWSIQRSFYNFNTASLPDDAVVGSAVLKLAYASHYTSNYGSVILTPNTLSSTSSLALGDFSQVTDTQLSTPRGIGGGTVGAYMDFTMNDTGKAYINKTGWTQLAARTSFDVENSAPGGTNYQNIYFSAATGTSMDPYLEVTYTVPTIPPTGTNLKVEGLSNPTSINTGTPKFTATFNDPDVVDSGAHYQIQVITENGDFASPLWDSTKIALSPKLNQGDTTPQITYGGTSLPLNNQKYKWRIKFWDDSGTEGPWSDGTDTFIVAPIVTATADMYVGCTIAQSGALNPEGVKCVAPTFSSVYNIGTSGTVASKYQIQVATTNDFSTGIVWDSGSTGTTLPNTAWNARTIDLVYKGSPLAMNDTRYYWRIKYWTTGNVESAWSPVGTFTTFSSRVYQNSNYTYDAVGNITNLSDGSDLQSKKSAAYGYDDLYRLTSATITGSPSGVTDYTQTYSYNILGNITNKSDVGAYSYAGTGKANPHAATTVGSSTYTYDDNGNVLTDGARTYTWNYDNTLNSVLKSSVTTTYGYDHARGRVSQSNGTVTTKYPNKFYNIDSTGKKTRHIFAGDQAVATIETVGSIVTARYMLSDQLGSSSVITSDAVQYNQPPVITINGAEMVTITQNGTYTELGASASDNEDGQLTPSITTTGTVDTSTLGSYFKTYSVTDSSGNTTQKIRTVSIIPPAASMPTPHVHWELDGAYNSSQKHSSSGSASGYTLTSQGYSSVAGKSGAADTAAQFNGTSDHFTAPTYNPGSNNFTVGVRFKANNYSMYNQTLYYEGSATNSNDNFNIHFRNDNRFSCEINGNGAVSYSVNPTNWTDVTCVKNGNYMYIYVNGTYHNNANAAQFNPVGQAYIGRASIPGSQNNFTFNGIIDSVKIYDNTALTWQQVPDIFAAPPNMPPTLTLTNSATPQVVQLNATYADPGATASDPEDGTLTSSVSVTGTVDTATLGTYTRTYSVTDSGGLTTKQTRTIVVVPAGDLVPTEAEVTDYYPYGGQRVRTGAFTEQKKFTGYEYDTDAGLSYAQARYYNQDTGRFSSQDPAYWRLGTGSRSDIQLLLDPQQQNSYNYARGNPLRYTDPSGEFAIAIGLPALFGGGFELGIGTAAVRALMLLGAHIAAEQMRGLDMTGLQSGTLASPRKFENQFLQRGPNGNDFQDPKNNLGKWGVVGTIGFGLGVLAKDYKDQFENQASTNSQLRQQSLLQAKNSFNSYARNEYGISRGTFQNVSTEQRYSIVQNYNSSSGASSPQSQLWVTPNGAVVNWGGGVVVSGGNNKK